MEKNSYICRKLIYHLAFVCKTLQVWVWLEIVEPKADI